MRKLGRFAAGAILLCAGGSAFAGTCKEVRKVRTLAEKRGLDTRSILQLEQLECGGVAEKTMGFLDSMKAYGMQHMQTQEQIALANAQADAARAQAQAQQPTVIVQNTSPYQGGYVQPAYPAPQPVGISDAEFDNTILRAVRQAHIGNEVGVCRQYKRVSLSVAQLSRVMQAVSASSQADCALTFFRNITDPQNWESVYRPMSIFAEQSVRAAIQNQVK